MTYMDNIKKKFIDYKKEIIEDIKRINDDFGIFRIFLPEFMAMLDDVKPSSRFNIKIKHKKEFSEMVKRFGFEVVFSDFLIEFDKRSERFKEFCKNPSSLIYAYVSKNPELAKDLLKFEFNKAVDDSFSISVGYPNCCIKEFRKNLDAKDIYDNHDPKTILLKKSKIFSWKINPLFLDYDPFKYSEKSSLPNHLLFHFPCSEDCMSSNIIADKTFEAIKKRYPYYIILMEMIMSKKVLFKNNSNFFILDIPENRTTENFSKARIYLVNRFTRDKMKHIVRENNNYYLTSDEVSDEMIILEGYNLIDFK